MSIPEKILQHLDGFDDSIPGWEAAEDARIDNGYATKSWSNTIEGTRVFRDVRVDVEDMSTSVAYCSQYSEIETRIFPGEDPFFILTSKGMEHPAFEIIQDEGYWPVVGCRVDEPDVHEFQMMELPWISRVVKAVFERFSFSN